MKRNTRAAFAAADLLPQAETRAMPAAIDYEMLNQFAHERRGYDPYDTARKITPDIWAAKPKRQ